VLVPPLVPLSVDGTGSAADQIGPSESGNSPKPGPQATGVTGRVPTASPVSNGKFCRSSGGTLDLFSPLSTVSTGPPLTLRHSSGGNDPLAMRRPVNRVPSQKGDWTGTTWDRIEPCAPSSTGCYVAPPTERAE